jgi:hypothetical protein
VSDVSLKEHLEQAIKFLDRHYDSKLVAMDRFFDAQNASMQKAVNTANDALNRRLEGMNEFRDTLKDQAGQLATKAQVESVEKAVRTLELSKENLAGKAKSEAVLWSGVISIIVGLITGFLCWKLFK